MSSLPCYNCITLSICKSYYISKYEKGWSCWMINLKLEKKCQLLYNYRVDESYEKTREFHLYMKPTRRVSYDSSV